MERKAEFQVMLEILYVIQGVRNCVLEMLQVMLEMLYVIQGVRNCVLEMLY